jgi:hypothetical protein
MKKLFAAALLGLVLVGDCLAAPDSYTKLLLHCNGVDTSTTFTDSSVTGYTVTAVDNAQIDTAQSKFGGASGLLDGTTDELTVPDNADWAFGKGDFSIDFWVRWNSLPAAAHNLGGQFKGADSTYFVIYVLNTVGVYSFNCVASSGTGAIVANSPGLLVNTWYHIALTRSGNNWRWFQDGKQIGTTVVDTGTIPDIDAILEIGSHNGANFFNGWVDEYRISKGIAR